MPRSLWKGAIAFGLVNIPVELYSAEDRKEFKFSMLDKRDLSPVGYKRYSKSSGKEVEWNNIVKGYEYEKDKYVVLSDEDFRRANVKASRTIDIQGFVATGDIAPQYFETPYFLAPGTNGTKAYALLREALRSTNRVAVAQFVLRSTQHLAAVTVEERALMLITLRYVNELRDMKDLELPAAGLKSLHVNPKEVELAKRLVDDMSENWKPNAFKDTYHQDLMHRIHEKIKKGQTAEITEPEEDEAPAGRHSAEVIDLAAVLRKSLEHGNRAAPKRPKKSTGKPELHVVHSTKKAPARKKRA